MPAISIMPTTGFAPVVGVQKRVTIPNPAPGADWSFPLPGGSAWRLLSLVGLLTTSAVVANRVVKFQTLDGAAVFNTVGLPFTQGQSVAQVYCLSSYPPFAISSSPSTPIGVAYPNWFLPAGYIIRAATGLIDVADQWSQLEGLFEEVDLGPYGETIGMVPVRSGATDTGE